ncbi:MAG: hypothetical protein WB799_09420 [Candidatus Sulfotelmatobacter sp.]
MFEQNLNTRFWLREESGESAPLDLIDVKVGQAPLPYEQFSLLFRGDRSKIHEQRTYAMEHDSMGAFDLFLTPVERNDQGTVYQAVFNRLDARLKDLSGQEGGRDGKSVSR